MRIFHLAGIVLFATAGPALAEDTGRYALEKTDDGYVRMDRSTGEMSLCTARSGQLVCKLAADERSAFEGELDRVMAKLEDLEKRLAAVENQSVRVPGLPSDEEIEKSLGYMEKFFRRFMDVMKDFDKDMRGADREPATPQKT
ncbi:MAG: hypothetical protein Q8Q62_09930 [Mesorhizobium sp.]|nr:hypothetical protein [Mesorhizobium sp.]